MCAVKEFLLAVASPGMDREADIPIVRKHFFRSCVQGLFEVAKEPGHQGSCLIATLLGRLWRGGGMRSFLFSLHMPLRACRDPSLFLWLWNRWLVIRRRRMKVISLRTPSDIFV